jgi:hypothetical protein
LKDFFEENTCIKCKQKGEVQLVSGYKYKEIIKDFIEENIMCKRKVSGYKYKEIFKDFIEENIMRKQKGKVRIDVKNQLEGAEHFILRVDVEGMGRVPGTSATSSFSGKASVSGAGGEEPVAEAVEKLASAAGGLT